MSMNLRLLVAVGIVVKFRHNQVAGQHCFRFSVHHHPGSCEGFNLTNSFSDRLVMRLDKAFVTTQHSHDGYTFWRGKGQVITRAVFIHTVLDPAQVAAIRQLPFQHFGKQGLIHGFSFKAQRLSTFPLPAFIHAADNVIIIFFGVIISGFTRGFH